MGVGRQRIGIAVIVVGTALAVAAMTLTANLVWVLYRPPAPGQLVDTYYVLPSPWITVIVFAVGAIGDLALRAQATRFGGRAALIWRTHLLFTTALLFAWLIAGTQAEMTRHVAIVVYAACPLMLFAHGAALAAAGLIMRRAGHAATRG